MKTENHNIRIVVLDDSDFYNRLLTRQLQSYTRAIAQATDFRFDIESYVHADDCIRNLKSDTDIAFLDYYLGNGITAQDVIREIRRNCNKCKVVVVSKTRNAFTEGKSLEQGASAFLYKLDRYTLQKSCFFVDELVEDLFH
ncbi:MAG: response regulator [Flavobacteriales bacterium]|nr:response regulator [Flavobacteriales bacterium]